MSSPTTGTSGSSRIGIGHCRGLDGGVLVAAGDHREGRLRVVVSRPAPPAHEAVLIREDHRRVIEAAARLSDKDAEVLRLVTWDDRRAIVPGDVRRDLEVVMIELRSSGPDFRAFGPPTGSRSLLGEVTMGGVLDEYGSERRKWSTPGSSRTGISTVTPRAGS